DRPRMAGPRMAGPVVALASLRAGRIAGIDRPEVRPRRRGHVVPLPGRPPGQRRCPHLGAGVRADGRDTRPLVLFPATAVYVRLLRSLRLDRVCPFARPAGPAVDAAADADAVGERAWWLPGRARRHRPGAGPARPASLLPHRPPRRRALVRRLASGPDASGRLCRHPGESGRPGPVALGPYRDDAQHHPRADLRVVAITGSLRYGSVDCAVGGAAAGRVAVCLAAGADAAGSHRLPAGVAVAAVMPAADVDGL